MRRYNGSGPTQASTVLVVDDDDAVRALLAGVLTAEGHRVSEAADGREAIKLLEQGRYDLVITDIVMPNVNGIEVLLAVRDIYPQCPVVMITGYPSVDTQVRLANLGVADYITNPFDVDVVRLTVARLLRTRRRTGAEQSAR